ncbi:MAG: hypothetical protein IPJ19_08435 [Planctomycetes bacterium]|nr:hypothetical protein [Planctomycetota bacterium]
MNLEEMQEVWAVHERRLERSLRLNHQLLRETQLDQTRSALRRLGAWLGFELATDLVVLAWLCAFAFEQRAQLRILLPAACLVLAWGCFLRLTLRQLAARRGIDFSGPTLAIQRALELLRIARIANTRWRILAAPILWFPLLVVGGSAFGHDVYAECGAGWLIAQALFGLALAPALFFASRKLAQRTPNSPVLQRIARDVAGRSLETARARVESIAAFEREESA